VYASATEGTGLIKVPTASKTIPRTPFIPVSDFIGIFSRLRATSANLTVVDPMPWASKIPKYEDWAVYTDIMGRKRLQGITSAFMLSAIRLTLFTRESKVIEPPHPRSSSIVRRPHVASIPSTHEQALARRHELDAEQRAYRDRPASREPANMRPRPPG